MRTQPLNFVKLETARECTFAAFLVGDSFMSKLFRNIDVLQLCSLCENDEACKLAECTVYKQQGCGLFILCQG